jgi:hypothetical protein
MIGVDSRWGLLMLVCHFISQKSLFVDKEYFHLSTCVQSFLLGSAEHFQMLREIESHCNPQETNEHPPPFYVHPRVASRLKHIANLFTSPAEQ